MPSANKDLSQANLNSVTLEELGVTLEEIRELDPRHMAREYNITREQARRLRKRLSHPKEN